MTEHEWKVLRALASITGHPHIVVEHALLCRLKAEIERRGDALRYHWENSVCTCSPEKHLDSEEKTCPHCTSEAALFYPNDTEKKKTS